MRLPPHRILLGLPWRRKLSCRHPHTKHRMEHTLADTIYDLAIIGGGPAGYTCGIRAAQLGLKVALIEKTDKLGGTCLHWGCIPTKALLFNAEIWDHMLHAAEYGSEGCGTATLHGPNILGRKSSIVTKHTKGLDFLVKKHKVARFQAYARLTGPAVDGVH